MVFIFRVLSRKTFEASVRLHFGPSTPAARKIDSALSNSDSIEGIPGRLLQSSSIPLYHNCRSKVLNRQSRLISRICKSHCRYLLRSSVTSDISAMAIKLSGLFDAISEILTSSNGGRSRWSMTFLLYLERSRTMSTVCLANQQRLMLIFLCTTRDRAFSSPSAACFFIAAYRARWF